MVQPLPVLIQAAGVPVLQAALHAGERKLRPVLQQVGMQCGDRSGLHLIAAETLSVSGEAVEACFRNLNTPEDFEAAELDETLRTGLHQSKHGG